MSHAPSANRTLSPALSDADREIVELLRAGQVLLMKYPIAARAAIRALVAEGRRFAETPEGRAWKEDLADSDLVRRGRIVWEGCSLNLLEDHQPTQLPSALLEAVLAAAASSNLEAMLSELFLTETSDDAPRDP